MGASVTMCKLKHLLNMLLLTYFGSFYSKRFSASALANFEGFVRAAGWHPCAVQNKDEAHIRFSHQPDQSYPIKHDNCSDATASRASVSEIAYILTTISLLPLATKTLLKFSHSRH